MGGYIGVILGLSLGYILVVLGYIRVLLGLNWGAIVVVFGLCRGYIAVVPRTQTLGLLVPHTIIIMARTQTRHI